MKVLRGGLIGCGYISGKQLWAWQNIDSAEIVAVCDLDAQKAYDRSKEYQIPGVYTDYLRMLDREDLDFIDIATGPGNHLTLVSECARRGLDVLCQKPIAGSISEAKQMVSVCEEAGVTFMVNENGRHQNWFRKLHALIDEGYLGDLRYARFEGRWRSTLPIPAFDGQDFFIDMPYLMIYEMGVHYYDIARYLFGEGNTTFACVRKISPYIAGEDMVVLISSFNELTLVIDMNWFSIVEAEPSVTWGIFRVEGTEGTAILGKDGKIVLYTERAQNEWLFPADTVSQSFITTQKHFIDCVLNGKEPETSGKETLKTMQLVFSAYRSADEGRVVSVDEDFSLYQLSPVSKK